ncbi:FAD-binding and (Fe-S)-binding domain-containing protein [uncultured Salipiger sp.]|uniref:FAD-binding and (Fe-S)-binding domain-containing protein n=1 Tax=uncultured Salipiger sp. TaxID=499810 RepID=UPI002595CBD0|nr:FAD-binding and (Fe-S)-binding domain-containing protein [uncultured Salipiger sp.]
MNAPMPQRTTPAARAVARSQAFEKALSAAMEGATDFGAFTRGRYATDASIYQIMPMGVAYPKSADDIAAALQIAAEHGVPVIARGGGTSQNGQPIGRGLILDMSRHFNDLMDYDPAARTVTVRPGMVLNTLNDRLRQDGLFFPVEPSTASRCTIGGMCGNNSSGARSLRFGKTVDNVLAMEGLLHDGDTFRLDAAPWSENASPRMREIMSSLTVLADSHRDCIEEIFPKVQRRVGGYNLDELLPAQPNLSRLLVGSEGTLAVSTAITLKLSQLPKHRVMGVCHFPDFRSAMETTQHLVALGPVAVELVDNNVLVMGADIPAFVRTIGEITKGTPNCLLLCEFAGADLDALKMDLKRLEQCMADHGHPDAVVEVVEPHRQKAVWGVREACLNIMMSMKTEGKPVSFIEDCAVPLEHLADYTDGITDLFTRHGTRGTWYAHASVGCLHVRPILNMKTEEGAKTMRAIAEEAAELVRKYKGSFSGEHGDGISRSEYVEPMFGSELTRAFETVKDSFDPENRLNPGKIVRPLRMDDRDLMRFKPGYKTSLPAEPALDWSDWGGFGGAVEMCNNNGTCRKLSGGTMCPSYRATRDEQHLTRGRANTLRLAISGQLGEDAFTSTEMKETLDLCVSCKGCKRDCPTGVDMARMKIEVLHHYHKRHGLPLREKLIAHMPRYAALASRFAPLVNLRDKVPFIAKLSEQWLGFSAKRTLPQWRKPWAENRAPANLRDVKGDGRDIVLFGDTFNRYFESENLEAAERVLLKAGYRLHRVVVEGSSRPMCCGRTYLASGQTDEARAELRRTLGALKPFVEAGARVVGLEPSCMFTFRDEMTALLPGAETGFMAGKALIFEELLAEDIAAGTLTMPVADAGGQVVHVHGHCHQKAFGAMGAVETVLRGVPGLDVRMIESSCCGMSGAFGYAAENYEVSMKMGEAALLPAVREAAPDALIVADGTSCRHQIHDGAAREAIHVARVLDRYLQ